MGIPTKDDFDYAINLKPWYNIFDWMHTLDIKSLSAEEINSAAALAFKTYECGLSKFEELIVVKWLYNQPAYQMAVRKLFKEKTTENSFSIKVEKLIKNAQSKQNPIITEREIIPSQIKWTQGLINTLHDYFYKDYAKTIIQSKENIEQLIESAEKFITSLEIAQKDPFLVTFDLPKLAHRPLLFGTTKRDSPLESIARLRVAMNENCIYPTTRIDKTLRERFLYIQCAKCTSVFFIAENTLDQEKSQTA